MNLISPRSRMMLAASYAVLIVLPCFLILLLPWLPQPVVVGTFLSYAFALLSTYYLDHWLLGGIGYHSLAIFAVLALMVAAMLWPLPLLSTRPTVWRSTRWRRAILAYGAVFIVFAAVAAWRMTRSWGLFFG
jgi:hypothetical protein